MAWKTLVLPAPPGARWSFRAVDIVLDYDAKDHEGVLQHIADWLFEEQLKSQAAKQAAEEKAAGAVTLRPVPPAPATTPTLPSQPLPLQPFQPVVATEEGIPRNMSISLDKPGACCDHMYGLHLKGKHESGCNAFVLEGEGETMRQVPCPCQRYVP